MSQKKTMREVKRVWILGAGASIDGARSKPAPPPSNADFLRMVKSYFDESSGRRNAQLWAAIKRDFSINGSNWMNQGLEEAIQERISRFDANSLFDKSRNSGKNKPTISNINFLSDINKLIRWWLSRVELRNDGSLVELAKVVASSAGAERVISFNYDMLIEEALAMQGVTKESITDFEAIAKKHKAKTYDPLLIKMHGSIDWVCDREDYEGNLLRGARGAKPSDLRLEQISKKEKLAESQISLIVPPMPGKNIGQVRALELMWSKAFKWLSNADEIVIFGYSCPLTDDYAEQLLSNLRPLEPASSKQRRVTIINLDAATFPRFFNTITKSTGWDLATWSYFQTLNRYLEIHDHEFPTATN